MSKGRIHHAACGLTASLQQQGHEPQRKTAKETEARNPQESTGKGLKQFLPLRNRGGYRNSNYAKHAR